MEMLLGHGEASQGGHKRHEIAVRQRFQGLNTSILHHLPTLLGPKSHENRLNIDENRA